MVSLTHQKRLIVSVLQADYEALPDLVHLASPQVDPQYLVRLPVRNLLNQDAAKQATLRLERRR